MGSGTACDGPVREARGSGALTGATAPCGNRTPPGYPGAHANRGPHRYPQALPPGTAGRREGVPARPIGSPRGTSRRSPALHWPGCPFPPSRLAERDGIPSGAGRRRSGSGRGRAPAAGAARGGPGAAGVRRWGEQRTWRKEELGRPRREERSGGGQRAARPRLASSTPSPPPWWGPGEAGGAGRGGVWWAGVGRGGAAWSGELRAASFARSAKVGLSPGERRAASAGLSVRPGLGGWGPRGGTTFILLLLLLFLLLETWNFA